MNSLSVWPYSTNVCCGPEGQFISVFAVTSATVSILILVWKIVSYGRFIVRKKAQIQGNRTLNFMERIGLLEDQVERLRGALQEAETLPVQIDDAVFFRADPRFALLYGPGTASKPTEAADAASLAESKQTQPLRHDTASDSQAAVEMIGPQAGTESRPQLYYDSDN
jgi:hypothetical protein